MSKTLERYLKVLRSPQPDADVLAALETAMAESKAHDALITALRSRLSSIEERDGPVPISLSLRKKLAATLMQRSNDEADDTLAAQFAAEAMEMFAHDLNDVDGLKAAVVQALIRGAADATVRRAAVERVGGAEYLLKELKRALKAEPVPSRKAAVSYAAARVREDEGDKAAAFTDLMRAVRAHPARHFVDELMRSALEQDRFQEAEAVLWELGNSSSEMAGPTRGYVLTKVGTLRMQHLGDDRGALDAFMQALSCDTSIKAAHKNARKLCEKLGIPYNGPEPTDPLTAELPPPAPPPVVEEPSVDSDPGLLPLPKKEIPKLANPLERTGIALLSDLSYRGPAPIAPVIAEQIPAGSTRIPRLEEKPVAKDAEPLPDAPLPRLLAHGFPGQGEFSSDRLARVVAETVPDTTQVNARPIPDEPTPAPEKTNVTPPPQPDEPTPSTDAGPTPAPDEPTPPPEPAPAPVDEAPQIGLKPLRRTPTLPGTIPAARPPDATEVSLKPLAREPEPTPAPAPVDEKTPNTDGLTDVAIAPLLRSRPTRPAERTEPNAKPLTPDATEVAAKPLARALTEDTQPAAQPLPRDEKTGDDGEPEELSEADLVEEEKPAPPRTAEDHLKDGRPDLAVESLKARIKAQTQPRVADLLLLADTYERELKAMPEALEQYARAATRLAERGDPRDVMLRRAVEGAIRVGKGNTQGLKALSDALRGKLVSDDALALERAAAEKLLNENPAEAAERLLRVFRESGDKGSAGPLFEQIDRAYALAGDRRGQAKLRQIARQRTLDARARLILDRERAELLRFDDVREYADALKDVLDDDPADGAALEKLLMALEQARVRGDKVDGELIDALQLAARLQKGEQGLPHLRRLARVREELKQRDEALRAWREVLSRRPGDAEALRMLTDLLEQEASQPARAKELIGVLEMRLTIAHNTRDVTTEAKLLPRLAALHGQMGDEGRRVQLLRDALRVDPNNAAALQAVEAHLLEEELFGELAELYEELATKRESGPGRVGANLAAATLYREKLQKTGRARELLTEVLKSEADNAEALRQMADLSVELGNPTEAVQYLTRALSTQKGTARAVMLTRLGHVHEDHLMQPDDAARAYREALLADPAQREAMEALLALAQRTGRTSEARSVAADLAALEQDPVRRADAFLNLARKARESTENEAAIRYYDTALTADPTRLEAVEELCWLLVQRGDGRRARPLLERLVIARGVDGVPAPLLVSLAKTQWASGETAHAKERLRAALRKDPAMLEALRALGDLLLAEKDEDPQEVLSVLEQRVLYHGEKLEKEELAFIHGTAGKLRLALGDAQGAQRSLKRALSLMPVERPDPDVLQALAKMAEEAGRVDESVELYTRLAKRLSGAAGASIWVKVGLIARGRNDIEGAARAFQEARTLDPQRPDVSRYLMEVEVSRGNGPAAIKAMMDLLEKETDAQKRAGMHVSLARIHRENLGDDEKASIHLRKALELSPSNHEALLLAEQIFLDRKDARGLVGVYTTGIRNLPAHATDQRIELLEKVALLRRYETKDLPGAIESLEEVVKLDDQHLKAREDLARIHLELGNEDKALQAWRDLLVRDPLAVEAYRGMLSIFRRQKAYDAAYCVASTMVALEEADDDLRMIVRSLRPPFPTWPRPTADAEGVARRLTHPKGRTVTRDLLAALSPHVLGMFVKPLSTYGLRRKDVLPLDDAPPSFALAAKQAARLLGLAEPTLFKGESQTGIQVVISEMSGLVLGPETLKGGMTPERAFTFGRAAAFLRPESLLCGALGVSEIKTILDACVLMVQPDAPVDGARNELLPLAQKIKDAIPSTEMARIAALTREHWTSRGMHLLTDLVAATSFTADRVGFLFAQDLGAAVSMLKQQTSVLTTAGVRSAIRELVLFSVSSELFALRQELGPSVNAGAAARAFGDT